MLIKLLDCLEESMLNKIWLFSKQFSNNLIFMYINQRLYVPSIEECILYVLFGLTILYLVNIFIRNIFCTPKSMS